MRFWLCADVGDCALVLFCGQKLLVPPRLWPVRFSEGPSRALLVETELRCCVCVGQTQPEIDGLHKEEPGVRPADGCLLYL